MSFLKELATKAVNDSYLKSLVFKLEKTYGNHFVTNTVTDPLHEKEYNDLLRFSDILCRSDITEARNLAYKIISLLLNFRS